MHIGQKYEKMCNFKEAALFISTFFEIYWNAVAQKGPADK